MKPSDVKYSETSPKKSLFCLTVLQFAWWAGLEPVMGWLWSIGFLIAQFSVVYVVLNLALVGNYFLQLWISAANSNSC